MSVMQDQPHKTPPAQPGAPPPSGSTAGMHSSSATSMREALDHLIGLKLSREAFAAEVVQLISRATGCKSVVLAASDAKRSRLSVLGSVGVDAKALEILASPAGRWIGLRCLNEHRINVIASARENPFVPQSLVSAISAKTLAIASIPFYHGTTPVGAGILFSPTPAAFTDGILGSLSQTLRHCGRVLAEPGSAPGETAARIAPLAPHHAEPPPRVSRPEPMVPPAAPPRPEPPRAPPPPAEPPRLERPTPRAEPHRPEPAGAAGLVQPHAEPARRAVPDADIAFVQRQLQEERKRVMVLENELAQSRVQAARLANQQAEVQRLNRQSQDTQGFAAQARAHAGALRLALVKFEARSQSTSPPANGLPGAAGVSAATATSQSTGDNDVLDVIVRLADSITALLNQALIAPGQLRPPAPDAPVESARLRTTAALLQPPTPTPPAAPAPAIPPPSHTAPVAPSAQPSGRPAAALPATFHDVMVHVHADLQRAFDQLTQNDSGLRSLRDRLHAWRIRRAESTEAPTDKTEIDTAEATWLLGDHLDDLIDEFDRLRRRVSKLSQGLDDRIGQGKAGAPG